MIVAALAGAIIWNLLTWRAGIPSSSSHALIGALIGMGIVGYGWNAVQWGKVGPVIVTLVTSPVVGVLLAYGAMVVVLRVFRRAHPGPANRGFRRSQLISSGLVSFTHGANDAQKTMGVITLALLSTGHLHLAKGETFPGVPLWVVLAAAGAIGLGTYAGGWRIIRTMGTRIIRLEPVDGFVAQTMAAVVIQTATQVALPVSTTHVVSGSVLGAGATVRVGAVRWSIARSIVGAWVLTIPASALMAGTFAAIVRL
jgi:PiT family inorganic phosphate transporter